MFYLHVKTLKIHFCIFDGSAEQFRQQQCLVGNLRKPRGRFKLNGHFHGRDHHKDERRTGDIAPYVARRGHEAARHVMTRRKKLIERGKTVFMNSAQTSTKTILMWD
ncbi:hypothetical protein Bbelb_028790 [Branchiostoma belcheri]|nr:hypothetical protein Bbelb_028790 [Branchiostoma belcheri]